MPLEFAKIWLAQFVLDDRRANVVAIRTNMKQSHPDPDGHCDRAASNLQNNLIAEGKRLTESGQFDQALATLFRAYSLRPGVTPVLHSIADIYEAIDDSESATACRRGVIPQFAEIRFFNAQSNQKRVIRANRASSCRHIKSHPQESITLSRPQSNAQAESRPEFRAKKTESRGSFVSVMQNAGFWFDGFNTVIMDDKQKILNEHTKGNVHLVADVARQRPERILKRTVCFLDARSSSIYYHWMIDILPKIEVLQSAGISLDSIDYFVVRCNSAFQSQTLAHLGIGSDRVIDPWNGGITRCDKLLVPFLKHDRGDRFYNGLGLGMARWVPAWLKLKFQTSKHSENQKLYISRATRGTRSPDQENILVSELQKRGFNCVSMESLSVIEQANLMAGASLVVAPHGAGLTNIAFCNPGSTVVEIFGDYVVPCYWSLSELSQLKYHAYFVENNGDTPAAVKNSDLKLNSLSERRNRSIDLDINEFLQYIDTIIAPEKALEKRAS